MGKGLLPAETSLAQFLIALPGEGFNFSSPGCAGACKHVRLWVMCILHTGRHLPGYFGADSTILLGSEDKNDESFL